MKNTSRTGNSTLATNARRVLAIVVALALTISNFSFAFGETYEGYGYEQTDGYEGIGIIPFGFPFYVPQQIRVYERVGVVSTQQSLDLFHHPTGVFVSTPFRPGYSLYRWEGRIRDAFWVDDDVIVSNQIITANRLSGGITQYSAIASVDVSQIAPAIYADSHISATFRTVQLGMEPVVDLNNFGVSSPAVVVAYHPNILAQYYKDITITNLRDTVPLAPLTLTLQPNNGLINFDFVQNGVIIPNQLSINTDFVDKDADAFYDRVAQLPFGIVPREGLPAGTHTNMVYLSQSWPGLPTFCFVSNGALHVAGLPGNLPVNADPLLNHRHSFEVSFSVMRPAQAVEITNPRDTVNRNAIIDFTDYSILNAPINNTIYNTTGANADFVGPTVYTNPVDPSRPSRERDITVTLEITNCNYSFFDCGNNFAGGPAVYGANALPITPPAGYIVHEATVVNDNLEVVLRPIRVLEVTIQRPGSGVTNIVHPPQLNMTPTPAQPQTWTAVDCTTTPGDIIVTVTSPDGGYHYTMATANALQPPLGYEIVASSRNIDAQGRLVFTLRQLPPNTHTVIFDLDNGIQTDNLPLSISVTDNTPVGVGNVPVVTRPGYTFAGWQQAPGGTIHLNTLAVEGVNITANTTFIAQWTPIMHTVTFVLNGGNVAGNTANTVHSLQQTTAIGTANVPVPVRAGYTFAGWLQTTGAPGGTHTGPQVAALTVNGPMTFTAQWTQIQESSEPPDYVTTPQPTPTPTPTASPSPTPEPTPSPPPTPGPLVIDNTMVGFGDNTIRPGAPLSRAQAITMFFRLLPYELRVRYWATTNSFTDISSNQWFNNAISTLENMGFVGGFPDGTFRPYDNITNAEMMALMIRFMGLEPLNSRANFFTDIEGHWAEFYINAIAYLGLVDVGGPFNPDEPINRAYTAQLFNRKLGHDSIENADEFRHAVRVWIDMDDETAWYYIEILLATNSFYVTQENGRYVIVGLADDKDWTVLEHPGSRPYHLPPLQ